MIQIANDGARLVSTNYWDSDHARRGLAYLSGNAGALRLLLPAAIESMLAEMRTGKRVLIEPSIVQPSAIDVVFDDGTDSPFALTIDRRQCDRALAPGKGIPFAVYTQAGLQLELAATVR